MFALTEDEYYSQLRGMNIVDTYMLDLGEYYSAPFPCLVVEDLEGNRYEILVSRDREQNGPGILFWDQIV
jgi:hypothetical protein